MDIPEALAFVRANHQAVLATTRQDGTPQLSPVSVAVDDAGRVVVEQPRDRRQDPEPAP